MISMKLNKRQINDITQFLVYNFEKDIHTEWIEILFKANERQLNNIFHYLNKKIMINNNKAFYSHYKILKTILSKQRNLQMSDTFEFLRNGLNNENDDIQDIFKFLIDELNNENDNIRKSYVNGIEMIESKLNEAQLNKFIYCIEIE
ncbi:hypothetical protein RFI_04883 [Reticulomyxa filosa]|uniref:Uncharacterized protein n=1 Tax=Reticulomyxa filosa TaxID=46433 RepID=X6P2D1_RETFI|nr:hypothetical protein RFI_04883 [Reticulomyxa filosa]|eukprot:ETO32234.1 hypothetical protein RFI_04883 [Reticulomyxa filosa]